MANLPPAHRNLWPAAFLMAIVVICVTFLAFRGVDTNVLLILLGGSLLPLLLQLYGVAEATKSQTNGNNAQLMTLLKEAQDKLYAATPAPPGPVPVDQAPATATPREPWAAGFIDALGRPLDKDGNIIKLERPE